MTDLILEEIKKNYSDNESLFRVYSEWGNSEYFQEIITILDSYKPEWYKEKELGSWAAKFILNLINDDEWTAFTKTERLNFFKELIEQRYEDFRYNHQFARVNTINRYLQDGEDLDAILAESDNKITFPIYIN